MINLSAPEFVTLKCIFCSRGRHETKPDRTRKISLEGLSVGDAFGETFFVNPDVVEGLIEQRALATRTWTYTDDTLMAMSIVSVLRQRGHIHQPTLARSFAERYDRDRGYGPAMHRLLWEIKSGEDWSERAQSLFGGRGSFGNGAAMRVAPVGAFFADDITTAVEQAVRSAVITHTHEEAVAGRLPSLSRLREPLNYELVPSRPTARSFWTSFYLMSRKVRCAARFARQKIWLPLLRCSLLSHCLGTEPG